MHALTAESFTGAAPRTRRRAYRQRAGVWCSLCLPRYRYPGAFARWALLPEQQPTPALV